jgi:YbbR domain-containing protein
MNRLGLKISCFLISVLIWIQVASTADVEQTTNLPLRVMGLGTGLTVAGSEYLPGEVGVKVTGKKWKLLTHQYFNRYIGEVRVNLAGFADSTFHLVLDRSHVFSEDVRFPEFKPRVTLRLTIDQELNRHLPVQLATSGALPEGLVFVAPPQTSPDSLLVTGPSRYFSDDLAIITEEVDLGRLSADSRQTLDLVSPSQWLELDRSEVMAEFRVGRLESRTLANIPVIGLVDAGRPEVGISPPVADVMVEGFTDWVRALTEDEVSVVVKTGNLEEGIYFLEGEVVHPDWVTSIRLSPAQFQVIVGNPPILRGNLRDGAGQEDQGE